MTMPCSNTVLLDEHEKREADLLRVLEANQKIRNKIKDSIIDRFEDDFTEWLDLLSAEEKEDLLREILFTDQTDRHEVTYVIQKERERVAEAVANQEALHTDDH